MLNWFRWFNSGSILVQFSDLNWFNSLVQYPLYRERGVELNQRRQLNQVVQISADLLSHMVDTTSTIADTHSNPHSHANSSPHAYRNARNLLESAWNQGYAPFVEVSMRQFSRHRTTTLL